MFTRKMLTQAICAACLLAPMYAAADTYDPKKKNTYTPPPAPAPARTYTPPAPAPVHTYSPPPAPALAARTYTPPAAPAPAAHSYAAPAATQIQHSYTPSASATTNSNINNGNHGYTPSAAKTYTPSASSNSNAKTYTPNSAATSAASSNARSYNPRSNSNTGAGGSAANHASTNASSATTYSPHASAAGGNSTANSHASNNNSSVTSYTPHAGGAAGSARSAGGATNGATTYTPHAAGAANGTTTFTPRASGAGSAANTATAAGAAGINAHAASNGGMAHAGTGQTSAAGLSKGAHAHTAYTPPAASAIASKGAGGSATLTHQGSQTVLSQVNSSRSGLKGINARPLPAGTVTTHSNGALTVQTQSGKQLGVRPNGTVASYKGKGESASFRGNGKVAAVHTASMDIHHGTNGQRSVVSHLAGKGTLVSTGHRRGYLEHSVVHGGHSFVERSYVVGGHHFSRVYAPYSYHGALLAAYVSRAYYAPGYYGWAYSPWAVPVAYRWGWANAPWYSQYGSYFAPYPAYAGAPDWLTDYALADTLSEAYDDQQGAVADNGDDGLGVTYDAPQDEIAATEATPITPELKQAIAQEVQEQLADEQAAAAAAPVAQSSASAAVIPASGGLQKSLKPNRVFLVSSSLDATTTDEQVCGLTPGDVLQLKSTPGNDDPLATLRVASSKRSDCPAGTLVQLSMQDMQDMQNEFQARIDSGLAALRDNQGKNGLPAAPAAAISAPERAGVAGELSDDSASVQTLLDTQEQQANVTETQVTKNAFYD